jgi:hypothetical protein
MLGEVFPVFLGREAMGKPIGIGDCSGMRVVLDWIFEYGTRIKPMLAERRCKKVMKDGEGKPCSDKEYENAL